MHIDEHFQNGISIIQDDMKKYGFGSMIALDHISNAIGLIRMCQSPIEIIFLIEAMKKHGIIYDDSSSKSLLVYLNEESYYIIQPQAPLEDKYIIDFLISWLDNNDNARGICLELDGHDFHEKTKQQAARDKARDRMLQASGYVVYRYTGSEVFRNTKKVLNEVEEYILNSLK